MSKNAVRRDDALDVKVIVDALRIEQRSQLEASPRVEEYYSFLERRGLGEVATRLREMNELIFTHRAAAIEFITQKPQYRQFASN